MPGEFTKAALVATGAVAADYLLNLTPAGLPGVIRPGHTAARSSLAELVGGVPRLPAAEHGIRVDEHNIGTDLLREWKVQRASYLAVYPAGLPDELAALCGQKWLDASEAARRTDLIRFAYTKMSADSDLGRGTGDTLVVSGDWQEGAESYLTPLGKQYVALQEQVAMRTLGYWGELSWAAFAEAVANLARELDSLGTAPPDAGEEGYEEFKDTVSDPSNYTEKASAIVAGAAGVAADLATSLVGGLVRGLMTPQGLLLVGGGVAFYMWRHK